MRRKICNRLQRGIASALFLIAISLTSLANMDLREWKLSAKIETKGSLQYKSFFVNDIIYRYAQDGLSDLRIVNGKGETLPYIIQNTEDFQTQRETEVSIKRTKVFQKKTHTYYEFEVISEDPATDPIGNVLQIAFSENDFLKNVALYGSYDGVRWEFIGNDQIYQINDLKKNEMTIDHEASYSHLRVVLLNNTENLNLYGGRWIRRHTDLSQQTFQRSMNLPLKLKNFPGYTLLTVKNTNRLKIRGIQLRTEGNFRRRYNIWRGKETKTPPYTSGEIYCLQFKEISVNKSTIELPAQSESPLLYQVKIINGDNRPLSIRSITLIYNVDKVIFETSGPPPYRLYINNPNAKRPSYDMESFKTHILNETQDPATLGPLTNNTTNSKKALPLDLRTIFNLVILIISLLLIVFLVKKLNPLRPS